MTPLERLADRLNKESSAKRIMAKARRPALMFFKAHQPAPFASIAAGRPTKADLIKAQQTLQAAIGKIPTTEIAEMDLRLRLLAGKTL